METSESYQLWGESFDGPGGWGLAGVAEAVVEAGAAALPELEGAGDDAVAAPEGGEGDFAVFKLGFHLLPFGFEEGA